MRDDFAVFILTHGRAKQQKTVKTLKRCGYTGRLYLIVDETKSWMSIYACMVQMLSHFQSVKLNRALIQ